MYKQYARLGDSEWAYCEACKRTFIPVMCVAEDPADNEEICPTCYTSGTATSPSTPIHSDEICNGWKCKAPGERDCSVCGMAYCSLHFKGGTICDDCSKWHGPQGYYHGDY